MKTEKILASAFTMESALEKVQMTEAIWNSKDPDAVGRSCTNDTTWRDRTEFVTGRDEVKRFLQHKWKVELDYKIKRELWGFRNNRMAVRFEYEWRDTTGQWFRSYGNELLEFDENGLMLKRFASVNDLPIQQEDRKLS